MRKGLSLLEMLFVVATICILVALAATQQGFLLTKSKEQVLSTKLLRAINAARSQAVLMGMTVSLCHSRDHETCNGEWQDGQIVFLDPEGSGQPIDKEHILYVFDTRADEGVLHWGSTLRHPFLMFTSKGMSRSDAGLFWYCPYRSKRPLWAISVSSTGKADMIYPDAEGRIDSIYC